MEKRRRLKVSSKPFSLDQFIDEQPNGNIGPSRNVEICKLDRQSDNNTIEEAFDVIHLMADSTANILDHTDQLSDLVQVIKGDLKAQLDDKKIVDQNTLDLMNRLHKVLFEMIASQSYQDVARQKMELIITNLKQAYQQLEEHNRSLEDKVEKRTQEIARKNKALESTLEDVERANKKIMDSIRYAEMIQTSILPSQKLFNELLPNSFTIWRPRDVVGGDLLVLEKLENGILVGVLDCTGHGVPGALMTMAASSELKQIVHTVQEPDPALMLRLLNENIKIYLGLDEDQALSDVGLDAALCYIDNAKKSLVFSGARIPLFYFDPDQDGIQLLKGQKVSIGYKNSFREVPFKNHTLAIKPGAFFWLTTDGITDQTNQDKGVSLGNRRLKTILSQNRLESPETQSFLLMEAFDNYRGQKEILDDITLVGFSI